MNTQSDTFSPSMEEFPLYKLASRDYPYLLHELPKPPKELWIRSKARDEHSLTSTNILPLPTDKILCIVGSRSHSPYGKEVCSRLISGLQGYPITIVSGLAYGIDSCAHEAALTSGLKTIAIPGSGLDWNVLYPARHTDLARRILTSGGALISPFPPDMKAAPWCFPWRNHLMAGISHMTLVIEAGELSGTLITADYALEFNRDVGAVPGSIFSHTSRGAHDLIRRGALLITSSADILEALGLISHTQNTSSNASNALTTSLKSPPRSHRAMTEAEKLIYMLIAESPRTRSELAHKLSMRVAEANVALSLLEIHGEVVNSSGTYMLRQNIIPCNTKSNL